MKALRKRWRPSWRRSAGGGGAVAWSGSGGRSATSPWPRCGAPSCRTDPQGFLLDRAALEELIELLAARPASKRGELSGIKPDRGDVILGGALVLAATLDSGGFDAIEVTEAGLREGVFERLLGDAELFDDVGASRWRTSPTASTATRSTSAAWRASLEMFDGLPRPGCTRLGDAERELLWAACVLHDIGTAIDYEDHHRHSAYLILNAGLPGFDPRELVLVGLIARYHRKGDPDASELGALAQEAIAERLRLLCAIIRLAEQLERSRDGAIRRVSVAAAQRHDHARRRRRPGARHDRADLGRPPERRPARGGARPRGRDRVIGRVAASLPLAVVLLDVTVVGVLLPDIRLDLGSSASGGQWVLNAYLLALAALLPAARAGCAAGADLAGGCARDGAGAMVCATADSTSVLVAGRAVQGAGMAAVLAGWRCAGARCSGVALPARRWRSARSWAGCSPQQNWWRVYFWAGVPLAAVGGAGALRRPAGPAPSRRPRGCSLTRRPAAVVVVLVEAEPWGLSWPALALAGAGALGVALRRGAGTAFAWAVLAGCLAGAAVPDAGVLPAGAQPLRVAQRDPAARAHARRRHRGRSSGWWRRVPAPRWRSAGSICAAAGSPCWSRSRSTPATGC